MNLYQRAVNNPVLYKALFEVIMRRLEEEIQKAKENQV